MGEQGFICRDTRKGILEEINISDKIEDVGGVYCLKKWAKRTKVIISNQESAKKNGVEFPRGVLIAGVIGCGKTKVAKAIAKSFGLKVYQLNTDNVHCLINCSFDECIKEVFKKDNEKSYVIYIDEFDDVFRNIDDVEKNKVKSLFRNLFTYMMDNRPNVFIIATANDIGIIPQEMILKRYFSEYFYVGLPNKEERKEIFSIYLAKYDIKDITNIASDEVCNITDGYSGMDIELVVKDFIEENFYNKKKFASTEDLLEAVRRVSPMSKIMKDYFTSVNLQFSKYNLRKASSPIYNEYKWDE